MAQPLQYYYYYWMLEVEVAAADLCYVNLNFGYCYCCFGTSMVKNTMIFFCKKNYYTLTMIEGYRVFPQYT